MNSEIRKRESDKGKKIKKNEDALYSISIFNVVQRGSEKDIKER
jgi:hypothetical protein